MSDTTTTNPQASQSLADRLRSVQVGVRAELHVSRHIFRGEAAYVVQDPITFASHEFSVSDYQILAALDDEVALSEIFERLVDRGQLGHEQEEDFYQFIVQLNQLGLLNLPVSDGKALFARFQQREAARTKGRLASLLFFRVPLFHPDIFLNKTQRLVAPLFSRTAFILWIVAVLVSAAIVARNWSEFADPLGTMLAIENLPILWCLLVGLKFVHEFGHAYACKHFGGHVPEMGAFFILFTPCAYVDASASWGFTNRWHRIVVSLAGMYFESAVAVIAVVVWCLTGPSVIHSAAQYAIILSTITTCAFNINPLMKYDGYYIVADLANMPNLRQHAANQITGFLKRVLFGVDLEPTFDSLKTRFLLGLFGLASACYKVVVLIGISAMIAIKIPLAGLGVAAYFIISTVWQLGSGLVRYLTFSEELASVRRRAVAVTATIGVLVVGAILTLPGPTGAQAQGLVAKSDEYTVRATATGFLTASDYYIGDSTNLGQPLCVLENPNAEAQLRQVDAQIDYLETELSKQLHADDDSVSTTMEQLSQRRDEKADLEDQLRSLTVTAPSAGTISDDAGLGPEGRFVKKGERLAVISKGEWIVDAYVNEETMLAARPQIGDQVDIRLDGYTLRYTGTIIGVGKHGERTIDKEALTQLGGGDIAVSPQTMQTSTPYFHVKIRISEQTSPLFRYGLRTSISFRYAKPPIGVAVYRRLLAFMNKLDAAS